MPCGRPLGLLRLKTLFRDANQAEESLLGDSGEPVARKATTIFN